MKLEEAVAQGLVLMARTLGNPPQIDAELIETWTALMTDERITPEDFLLGAKLVARTETFFPAPVVVIEAIREILSDRMMDAESARLNQEYRRFEAKQRERRAAQVKEGSA